MVEDIVNLPAQLNFTLFAEPDVLEKSYVIIEDRGKAKGVSRHVADLETARLAKAGRIDRKGQSGRVFRTNQLVWITEHDRTGIYFTTAKVRNCRRGTGSSFRGGVGRRLNESSRAGVSQNYSVAAPTKTPIQTRAAAHCLRFTRGI